MGDEMMEPWMQPTADLSTKHRCRVCNNDWFKNFAYRPATRRLRFFGYTFREAKPERLESTCTQCGYVSSSRPGTTTFSPRWP